MESWRLVKGPWSGESDKEEFRFAGFPCLAVRNKELGNWCGYVGVPPSHPAYEADYEDVDARAHGGLTYARRCEGDICHTPREGESDDVWWLGFDCAHLGDFVPGMKALAKHALAPLFPLMDLGGGDTYRDLAYVKDEIRGLAHQLARMVTT